jgi:hypothetical protein
LGIAAAPKIALTKNLIAKYRLVTWAIADRHLSASEATLKEQPEGSQDQIGKRHRSVHKSYTCKIAISI